MEEVDVTRLKKILEVCNEKINELEPSLTKISTFLSKIFKKKIAPLSFTLYTAPDFLIVRVPCHISKLCQSIEGVSKLEENKEILKIERSAVSEEWGISNFIDIYMILNEKIGVRKIVNNVGGMKLLNEVNEKYIEISNEIENIKKKFNVTYDPLDFLDDVNVDEMKYADLENKFIDNSGGFFGMFNNDGNSFENCEKTIPLKSTSVQENVLEDNSKEVEETEINNVTIHYYVITKLLSYFENEEKESKMEKMKVHAQPFILFLKLNKQHPSTPFKWVKKIESSVKNCIERNCEDIILGEFMINGKKMRKCSQLIIKKIIKNEQISDKFSKKKLKSLIYLVSKWIVKIILNSFEMETYDQKMGLPKCPDENIVVDHKKMEVTISKINKFKFVIKNVECAIDINNKLKRKRTDEDNEKQYKKKPKPLDKYLKIVKRVQQ